MYFSNLYPPRLADTNMHIYHTFSSVKTWRRRILLHLQFDPLHVLSALKERSFLVVPRVQVGEQQFQATGWWACPSFSVMLSFAAKKVKNKNKNIALSCCGQEVTLSNQAFSFCSWKNSLDNKRHAGLLWSSLFLAHFCKNPYLKM